MKTSKIISLSLLVSIALIILASAIYIKIEGKQDTIPSTFTSIKKEVASFRILSINNATNITLIRNDSSFIEISCLKDSLSKYSVASPVVNYSVHEDTLKIADFRSPKGQRLAIDIKVNFTDSLTSIKLKNSSAFIKSLGSGKLSIKMDSSSIMANDQSKESNLKALDVFAKNKSDFQIRTGKFRIDTLNMVLLNSNAYLWSEGNRLKCDISNKSNVRVTEQPLEIVMKKDSTSQFSVREIRTVFR